MFQISIKTTKKEQHIKVVETLSLGLREREREREREQEILVKWVRDCVIGNGSLL